MSTDTAKPRMGRINLQVPMGVKSIAVRAAQKSGMNLETWATKALEEQGKATLCDLAWHELVQRLYEELRKQPLARVSMFDTGELRKWSPWYHSTEGPAFGDEVQRRLRNLGIDTTFEWRDEDNCTPYLWLRRIPMSYPNRAVQELFGELPLPSSTDLRRIILKNGEQTPAEFDVIRGRSVPCSVRVATIPAGAPGFYNLSLDQSTNTPEKAVSVYEFGDESTWP